MFVPKPKQNCNFLLSNHEWTVNGRNVAVVQPGPDFPLMGVGTERNPETSTFRSLFARMICCVQTTCSDFIQVLRKWSDPQLLSLLLVCATLAAVSASSAGRTAHKRGRLDSVLLITAVIYSRRGRSRSSCFVQYLLNPGWQAWHECC